MKTIGFFLIISIRGVVDPKSMIWQHKMLTSLKPWRFVMFPVLALIGVTVGIWMEIMTLGRKRSIRGRHFPRLNATFVLYLFLRGEDCDALVGDLEERYKIIRKKFGARRANFWYWVQVITSITPIVWAWFKKHLMKPILAILTWAAGKGLLDDNSWLAALVEMLRRIRS